MSLNKDKIHDLAQENDVGVCCKLSQQQATIRSELRKTVTVNKPPLCYESVSGVE